MAKHPLTILEAELSVPAIGLALGLSPDEVLKKFSDPRVTSWFAEIWGERLFRYKAHLSSNHPGSDARVELGALGRFDISVRCFNRNTIKFQKSKFIGSGRSATLDDLIEFDRKRRAHRRRGSAPLPQAAFRAARIQSRCCASSASAA